MGFHLLIHSQHPLILVSSNLPTAAWDFFNHST